MNATAGVRVGGTTADDGPLTAIFCPGGRRGGVPAHSAVGGRKTGASSGSAVSPLGRAFRSPMTSAGKAHRWAQSIGIASYFSGSSALITIRPVERETSRSLERPPINRATRILLATGFLRALYLNCWLAPAEAPPALPPPGARRQRPAPAPRPPGSPVRPAMARSPLPAGDSGPP